MLKENKKSSLISNLKDFIIDWNRKYPIDRWYRKKYNIPFGSEEHKRVSFLNMRLEYEEDLLFFNLEKKRKESEIELEDYLMGKYLKRNKEDEEISEEELDDLFNSIDISKLNNNIKK